ncbi:T9SS type A sorting domain-containing protein [bacterium]|nr:T9SS type A sorting domain-containing protein [bacterium]
MRYTIITVLSIIALLAAGIEVELYAQDWSEPVELTDVFGQVLDNDYKAAVDSRGNIHLVYEVKSYQERFHTFRVFYSKFNPHGELLRDTILPMGEDIVTHHGSVIIDNDDNAHIISLGRDERGEELCGWYCCIDSEGEYIVDPTFIEDLYYTPTYYPVYFFRRNDGTFIYSTLAVQRDDDDSHHLVSYIRFRSDGEIIGEVNYLWSDENMDGAFYLMHPSLDNNDNMHFVWRFGDFDWNNTIFYGCVSSDDEVITDMTAITPHFNEINSVSHGFQALDINSIYMLMVDGRLPNEPHINYLRRMNHETEAEFNTPVLYHYSAGGSINLHYWQDRIYVYGKISPDSLDISYYYYTSVDTTGDISDSLELIAPWQSRYSSSPQFLRSGNILYLFYIHYFNQPEDAVIKMIQKNVEPNNVPNVDDGLLLYSPLLESVYPNPFNNSLNMQINLPLSEYVNITLYNLEGRLLLNYDMKDKPPGLYRLSLMENNCLMNLPSGVYILKLRSSSQNFQLTKVTKLK